VRGEPLAWLVGGVRFCGLWVKVHPGVYVPRWQSEALSRKAASLLPSRGRAVDLCTGSGAIAVVLSNRVPDAHIVGIEIDPVAAACARENGVQVIVGDLDQPLPEEFQSATDLVVGVVPYVPTAELAFLPRDVIAYEPSVALDGGVDGVDLLLRAASAAAGLLVAGGALCLEIGGDEATHLGPALKRLGFGDIELIDDDDGDVRGIIAFFCQ
jgi:release factor glutamine methyltransferase